MQPKKEGFTLIELLVIVLIIGILSAVALPQYEKAVEKSRAAEAISVLNSLKKATDAYILANGPQPAQFLGSSSTIPPGELDIDFSQALTCDENKECRSKNFTYSASCARNQCLLIAHRTTPGFSYELRSYWENGAWNNACRNDTSWNWMAKSLAAQGWKDIAY